MTPFQKGLKQVLIILLYVAKSKYPARRGRHSFLPNQVSAGATHLSQDINGGVTFEKE
jgi:hypothetical protein